MSCVFCFGVGWGWPLVHKKDNYRMSVTDTFRYPTRADPSKQHQVPWRSACFFVGGTSSLNIGQLPSCASLLGHQYEHSVFLTNAKINIMKTSNSTLDFIHTLMLADIDPASAKLAVGILGPFLSAFAFLFILRIVMSWYPKLPVGEFPFVIAYAPTEPLLIPTRKVIPPLGGVDITPVVWFGLISFLNEILVGPQGILVLFSQQVN
uniref:Protein COFACTOR ASSEMBLY OF COMPLEX C SUBUNIT B CCB3, chloroplastic n=1 Tax=Rhizophora mucronata TaxID=61149 RepID=A0A2P2JYS2_RHIMU